ncbi:MAG: TIGR03936 family radical SAM-associated protein [Oscillospiraceae bacterium]|nr:TIGR03936 family radical SAM-associated protein [Oscillospiraceae bacterium]
MDKLRLRFEKTGRAIYISHLDLMATMQRAFSRADLPLKYSEGFNPHPLISILLPLPVGMASVCELMDFRLKEEEPDLASLPEKLTAALPEGICVKEAYPAERKSALLKWLSVEGTMEYDRGAPELEQLRAFFAQPELIIEKKTKRGIGMSDIRPAIGEILFEEAPDGIRVSALVSAQEPTLNPELLVSALRQLRPELAPDFARFTRLETYDAQRNLYR